MSAMQRTKDCRAATDGELEVGIGPEQGWVKSRGAVSPETACEPTRGKNRPTKTLGEIQ